MLPVNLEEAKRSIICRFARWSDREECVERRDRKRRVQSFQSSQTYPRPWGPNALTHWENAEWWGETRGSRLEWCRDSWWLPAVDSAHSSPFFSIALMYFLLSLRNPSHVLADGWLRCVSIGCFLSIPLLRSSFLFCFCRCYCCYMLPASQVVDELHVRPVTDTTNFLTSRSLKEGKSRGRRWRMFKWLDFRYDHNENVVNACNR